MSTNGSYLVGAHERLVKIHVRRLTDNGHSERKIGQFIVCWKQRTASSCVDGNHSSVMNNDWISWAT